MKYGKGIREPTRAGKPKYINNAVQIAADLAEALIANNAVADVWVTKLLDVPPRYVQKFVFNISPYHFLLVRARLEGFPSGMRQYT